MAMDPFYVIRDELQNNFTEAAATQELFRHEAAAATPDSERLQWMDMELRNQLSAMELKLQEFERVVDVMQRDPARFRLDAAEVASRKDFVLQAKSRLNSMLGTANSPENRAIMERTVRNALVSSRAANAASRQQGNSKFAKLDAAIEADNQAFVDQSLAQRQMLMDEQDANLDEVAAALAGLGQMATQITRELDTHERLLEEIDADTDRVAGRLQHQMKKLDKLLKSVKDKKSMCLIVVLILILFILLILIVTWK
eukprot:c10306_g1_i1.p1 GENE.c10306_g1_i1~~c10306_g1_i1.p1  ORF type:complete len:274 (+),score=64.27 c10306_g1_i1:55-822(+)